MPSSRDACEAVVPTCHWTELEVPSVVEEQAIGNFEPNMLEVLLRIDKRSRFLSLEDEFCVEFMPKAVIAQGRSGGLPDATASTKLLLFMLSSRLH